MERLNSTSAPQIRPLPLKIAGIIGLLTSAFYLAVAVGQDDGLGPAIFWLILMVTASLLSWFADQFQGRASAVIAAGLFFVLGILSPLYLAIVFLVAVLLCVVGFIRLPGDE